MFGCMFRLLFSGMYVTHCRILIDQRYSRTGTAPANALDEAARHYRRALELPKQTLYLSGQHYLAITHNNLGSYLERQGKFTEARDEYLAAVKVESPDFWYFRSRVSFIFSFLGVTMIILVSVRPLMVRYPHLALGKLHERFGQVEAAIAQFKV